MYKHLPIYHDTLKDLDEVVSAINNIREHYESADVHYQVNMGIFINKIVDFIQRDLIDEVDKGFNNYLKEIGYDQQ